MGPNGKRQYPPHTTYLPAPPPGRPRFAHQRLTEEFNATLNATFRTYLDDLVVVYGRVILFDDATPVDPTVEPRDWAVVVWSGHPLLTPKSAKLLRYVADRSTYSDALAALDDWELNGSGDES